MANPWMKFYTSDWRSDPCLRMCGIAARGLWIEMICLMHEATPYGHLLVNGQRPTDAQLAVLVGATPDQIAAMLGELEAAGAFSRTREGVIYSRRLSRMAKKAATARNNGRKGGNPTLCKSTENTALDKGMDKDLVKTQIPEARSQKRKEEAEASSKNRARRVPEDLELTDAMLSAAEKRGVSIPEAEAQLERFKNYHIAKGNKFQSFDRASWPCWAL